MNQKKNPTLLINNFNRNLFNSFFAKVNKFVENSSKISLI